MAQATDTIIVNDGAVTPVAVTFKTVKASPALTVWKDKRLLKPVYWPEISLSADLPVGNAPVRKAELRVAIPVVDAITGKVTDTIRFRLMSDLPTNALQADINNAFAYFFNAGANALVKGAIRDLDPIIG